MSLRLPPVFRKVDVRLEFSLTSDVLSLTHLTVSIAQG